MTPSPGLLEILRSALARLEEDSQTPPNDPAARRFKQRILRSIAQLELQRSSLRAPDVIIPEATPHSPEPSTVQPISPDSVVVLVAPRRARKRRSDDSADGGNSSAA